MRIVARDGLVEHVAQETLHGDLVELGQRLLESLA
jgi:hypothetical protein